MLPLKKRVAPSLFIKLCEGGGEITFYSQVMGIASAKIST